MSTLNTCINEIGGIVYMIPITEMDTMKSASDLYTESLNNPIESQLKAIIYNCNMNANGGDATFMWSGTEIHTDNISALEAQGYHVTPQNNSVSPQYLISWITK